MGRRWDELSESSKARARPPRSPKPDDTLGDTDPVCLVCLRPIKSDDMVRGRRDELIHAECDYTRR